MAEGIRFISEDPEASVPTIEKKEKEKKDKNKKRKGASFDIGKFAAGSAELANKSKNEKPPEKRKLNWNLPGIVETVDLDDKPKNLSLESSPQNTTEEARKEADIDREVAEGTKNIDEEYEELISRELAPHEFSGGEVIIDLHKLTEDQSEAPAVMVAEGAEAEPESNDPEAVDLTSVTELAPETVARTEDEESEETTSPPVVVNAAGSGSAGRSTPNTPSSPFGSNRTPYGSRGSGGRGRPPVPPQQNGTPGGPAGPNNPLYQYNMMPPAPQANMDVAPANTTKVQQAIDDAEYYGRKRGRSEGFWTGALLVGGYEHFKHRRREKRINKKFKAEQTNHAKTLEDIRWDRTRTEQNEKLVAAEATKYSKPEYARGLQAAEQVKPDSEESHRLQRELEVEKQRQLESIEIPAGHHVERSAWHSVEVDEHGRAVENSAIDYGHEYYQERTHEAPPVDKTKLENVTGGVALTAAAMSDVDEDDQSAEAQLSRENRALAEQHMAQSTNSSSPKKSQRSVKAVSMPSDTIVGLIPWIIVLIIIVVLIRVIH